MPIVSLVPRLTWVGEPDYPIVDQSLHIYHCHGWWTSGGGVSSGFRKGSAPHRSVERLDSKLM